LFLNSIQKIAVIGLGYVGIPLAVEFGKIFSTIGFDLSSKKIESYKKFIDPTGEIDSEALKSVIKPGGLDVTDNPILMRDADIIIIAVPTPVDNAHIPDFQPLIDASIIVAKHMKAGAIIVYESTVYPGATEEICIPILEKHSALKWKRDFFVGYSPERINPGDKEKTLTKITKVVSGDTPETLQKITSLYEKIIQAGVHKASSIKVAEAAKVIENTQRDLNIALMNELAIIFHKIGIDTKEVLQAAGTKWNFLNFKPGLVGGHCIGVDPYYLTYKAEMLGYHPQIILAGRRINDGMSKFVAENTVKLLIKEGKNIKEAKIIILGFTFKEDCPDLRNTKVFELIEELNDFGCKIFVHDPIADHNEAKEEYNLSLVSWGNLPSEADAVIVAVPHNYYLKLPFEKMSKKFASNAIFIDVKSAFNPNIVKASGFKFWRL
jgi:UDP-N-acetyl-D-galactosamine dehydrogenase